MKPGDARQARRTAAYRRARAAFLDANPLCAACRRDGRTVGAAELDHIVPIEDGGDFWDHGNWQPLCRPCHEAKTGAENRQRAAVPGRDAWDAHLEATYGSGAGMDG